jgi:hypothetical protein
MLPKSKIRLILLLKQVKTSLGGDIGAAPATVGTIIMDHITTTVITITGKKVVLRENAGRQQLNVI